MLFTRACISISGQRYRQNGKRRLRFAPHRNSARSSQRDSFMGQDEQVATDASPADATDTPVVSRSDYERLQREIARLRDQVDRLTQTDALRQRENQQLRELIQHEQATTGSPAHIGAMFPEPESRDPEDYEHEHPHHAHQQVYPNNGTALRLPFGWQVIAASQRGRLHGYKGKYREDDFAVRPFAHSHGAAIAIADGLGSKEYSRWGARAAAHGALVGPREHDLTKLTQLIELAGPDVSQRHQQSDRDVRQHCADRDNLAHQIIVDMFQMAKRVVERTAINRGKSLDELHSTLLVFLAIPHHRDHLYVASAQVGDGALHAQCRTGMTTTWTLLEDPQRGGVDNHVQPFLALRTERYQELIHTTDLTSPLCILGMTDGTQDDIEDPDRFNGIENFYRQLRSEVAKTSQPATGLATFLTEYFYNGSLDDRTVACLFC